VLVARPGSAKSVSSTPVVVLRGDRLSAANPANETLVDLEGTPPGQPLNVEPSPDGRRVAFEVLGGNLFVISIDGAAPVDLGSGHRPQWSPDGEWVVFMKTEDDGHVTTASDLFAARADGSSMVRLTASPDALEMNPSWSPDGRRIAFDEGGAIYVMRVSN
jgi:Tol biopolymer transport system component